MILPSPQLSITLLLVRLGIVGNSDIRFDPLKEKKIELKHIMSNG